MGVMACTRFWLQGRSLHNEESESCLSCRRQANWSSSFLPNIIKIYLRVSKLLSAQDFGFRVDNYITKKVRVVSPAQDTLTGPPLHFYQMPLPNIIKIYLRVSKLWRAQNFGFWGDNFITKKKVRVVSLANDMSTGPPFHPYQILSNYLKQYGSNGLHKISNSGEITT